MGKAVAKVYRALRSTRDGRYSFLLVGFTAEFIESSCSIQCLHAPEVHSGSDSCSGLGRVVVDADGTFEEVPVRIIDSRDQVLQCKTMRLVKVLW